jgi:hypothetical protein
MIATNSAKLCDDLKNGKNIVLIYLENTGQSFDQFSDGWCGGLTHKTSNWLEGKGIKHRRLAITRAEEEGDILFPNVETQPEKIWYHSVIEVDGIIHDPWLDERLKTDDYMKEMFPGQKVCVEEDYEFCIERGK